MKYTLVNASEKNAMRLQGIGLVLGTPAQKIKKGDFLLWNFGYKSEVKEIIKETEKTITISILSKGGLYERKLYKNRLVCILK